MKFLPLAAVLVLVCALLSGCAQSPPVVPPQPLPQTNLPPMPPTQPAAVSPQPDIPPLPAETPTAVPAAPPQNVTPAAPAPPIEAHVPVVAIATLKVGQSINFEEGKLTLDDIWVYSPPNEPALTSLYYPDGKKNRSVQMFPGTESRFISKTGTPYWIWICDTQAGYDIYVKRVKFYIFEARDSNDRFNKSLYSDIIGECNILSANSSVLFGSEAINGVVENGGYLNSTIAPVRFDGMDREPANDKPVLVTIRGQNNVTLGYAKLGGGKAYVYRSGGQLFAVHNEGGFVAKNGTRYANLHVYEAKDGALENRTYVVGTNFQKPKSYLIEKFDLFGSAYVDTQRSFYIQLAFEQSTNPSSDGVVVNLVDSDGFSLGKGMVKRARPLYVTFEGKKYSFWLEAIEIDSTSGELSASVSMYREA